MSASSDITTVRQDGELKARSAAQRCVVARLCRQAAIRLRLAFRRVQEGERVMATFKEHLHLPVTMIDDSQRMLTELKVPPSSQPAVAFPAVQRCQRLMRTTTVSAGDQHEARRCSETSSRSRRCIWQT